MPKKSNVRSARVTTSGNGDPRRTHPVRSAPRPTTSVPVETAAVTVHAPAEPVVFRPTQVTRPTSPLRINRPARASTTLIADYGYVSRDLTRIAALAGLAFLVLIGLTFVIH